MLWEKKKLHDKGHDGSWDNPNKFLQGLVIFFYSKLCESATGSLASFSFIVHSNNPIASGIHKVLILFVFQSMPNTPLHIKQTVFDFASYLNIAFIELFWSITECVKLSQKVWQQFEPEPVFYSRSDVSPSAGGSSTDVETCNHQWESLNTMLLF